MALPRWPRGFPALPTPHQRFDELRVIDAGAAYVAVAVEDACVCTEVTREPRAVRRRAVPVVGGIPNHHSLARQLDVSGIDPNQASRSEGFELEMRWQATERMSVIAAYTNLEVVNLNMLENGGRFSFLGAGDLPGTDSPTFYGDTVGGFVTLASNPDGVRAGVPKHLASVTALYEWEDWRVFASVADVASVYSGFSRRVKLPPYTLVNAGLQYDGRRWSITVSGKNLTDERYFRANFPNLFGGVIVLPELPRNFQASVAWKF